VTATVVDIHRERAREQANVTRLAADRVRRELREHRMEFAEAIFDPRAGSLTVERLLRSVPGVGRHAVPRVLEEAGVLTHAGFGDPTKRVGRLTDRQCHALVEAVKPYLRKPRGRVA
jgi:hypothetical protein